MKAPREPIHAIAQEDIDKIFVPLVEQIQGVEREITLRRKVYPTRVNNNRMSYRMAVFQVALMKAVLKTLKELEAKTRLL